MTKEERMKQLRARRPLFGKIGSQRLAGDAKRMENRRKAIESAEQCKRLMQSGLTLQEIANIKGVTRERIRQILQLVGYSARGDKERQRKYFASVPKERFVPYEIPCPTCKVVFLKDKGTKKYCSHICMWAKNSLNKKEIVVFLSYPKDSVEAWRYIWRIRVKVWTAAHRGTPEYKERTRRNNIKYKDAMVRYREKIKRELKEYREWKEQHFLL